ncbi:MAG: GNAT family N-acetyltransferase [Deltaproteobacteria bacterium]|nr:GNAT family N-acetyltransferase [Deltaproteobacteria bacterium]
MEVAVIDAEKQYSSWTHFVLGHPNSTVYHTIEWKAVIERTFGYQPYYMVARQNGRILGVLPAFIVPRFRKRFLISMPLRDYGGILAETRESERAIKSYLDSLQSEYQIILKSQYFPKSVYEEGCIRKTHLRSVIDIPANKSDYDNILRGKAVWRAIKKSMKMNVIVSEAASDEEWREFYLIFLRTRKRLGIPPFEYKLFDSIKNAMVPRRFAFLLLARKERSVIAGMLLFMYRDKMTFAYGASDKHSLHCRPNDRLFYEAIQRAICSKMRLMDLGADHPSQQNLISFKNKWGARVEPVSQFFMGKYERSWQDMENPMTRVGRIIIRNLPMSLFRRTSWIPRLLAD